LVGQSVGQIQKKKKPKKNHKKTQNRRPGTPDSLLWSLETTRHGPKINMAEKLVDVILKLRQCGKNGSTTKTPLRHTSIPHFSAAVTMLIFQIKRII